ncbi:MAG: hypothetical protein QM739_04245 [Propionivibrio sp.]
MKAAQPTPQAPVATMESARLAFECLIEQERDVFALVSAIRELGPADDTALGRLIYMAWDKLGNNKHQKAIGDYFGVDIYADSQGEDGA